MSGRPLDVLEEALDGTVTVHLKDGRAFHGTLAGYDQHMNVVLAPTDETDEAPDGDSRAVGDTMVIRGDNLVTIET